MSPLPSLENLRMLKGDLEQDKKKPTVIEFWAPWCPPCRLSVPHMNSMYEKYRGKANFIAICTDATDMDAVSGFITRLKPQYPVAVDETGNVVPRIMKDLDIRGIPHAVVFDTKGESTWTGHPTKLEAELEKL